jgi:hypothetical protein
MKKRIGPATTLYGTVALSFVIPSEAEGTAVSSQPPMLQLEDELSSRLSRRAAGPKRSVAEGPAVSRTQQSEKYYIFRFEPS